MNLFVLLGLVLSKKEPILQTQDTLTSSSFYKSCELTGLMEITMPSPNCFTSQISEQTSGSFIQNLLGTFCMPGTVLGLENYHKQYRRGPCPPRIYRP